MTISWFTTYMVLAQGLSYDLVRRVLHFVILKHENLYDLLYSHVTNLLFKHNWIIIGEKKNTWAFRNYEVFSYWQNDKESFNPFSSTTKKYPRQMISFSSRTSFHFSDSRSWVNVFEDEFGLEMNVRKDGVRTPLSIELVFETINKFFT